MRQKILVSIDSALVERLDRVARARGLTRSALIAELAARQLGTRTPPEQRRIEDAHGRLVRLFERNPTDGDPLEALRAGREERLERISP